MLQGLRHAFDDSKASVLGDYLPAKLEMEEGETILWAGLAGDYTGQLLFFFANGKVAPGTPGQLPDGDPPEEAHGGLL